MAVALTYSIPKTEAEKIINDENLALEMKSIWKLNSVSM
jgi:hypothetical protein